MDIRKKLTLLFVVIVALILLLSSLSIYYFSANYRQEDFYLRLKSKGQNAAKLLIEVEEIDARLLQKIERDNPQNLTDEKLVIFNYQNETLYGSEGWEGLAVTPVLLDEIRLEGEVKFKSEMGEVLGFMFIDTYDRFVVVVAARDVYGLRKISNLRLILILVFIGGILIATLLGWVYAGRALKPISKVVSAVEKIGIHSLDQRIYEGETHDEIAKLAHTFNKMLSRLEKAFVMQKNFISNASHELRTPLTAIGGQLEVMLMKERSPEAYRQTLASVYDDIRGLGNTANRLLLLAQADSELAKKDFSNVRIDEVLWIARAEVLKRDQRYLIDVNLNPEIKDEHQLTVEGNAQLLKTAIINLMDNGCKYSSNHTVVLSVFAEEQQLIMQFKDSGIGIPAEDVKRIFEPFHRAPNAITYKGHGIGLSLVSSIAELHQGSVSVQSVQGSGSLFTLQIRLADKA